MLLYSLFCVFFASLLVTLNAMRLYDLVRAVGFSEDSPFHGCIGVVKSIEDGGVQVKMFFSKAFLNIDPVCLSHSFWTLKLKSKNLSVIGPEQWKVDGLAHDGLDFDALMPFVLQWPAEKMAEFGKLNARYAQLFFKPHESDENCPDFDEELKILAVWSNQTFGTSFIDEFPDMNPFQYGTFVSIEGLVNRPEFNGHLGVVNTSHEHFVEVLIFLPGSEPLGQEPEIAEAFKPLLVRHHNLKPWHSSRWWQERKRTDEELRAIAAANRMHVGRINHACPCCLYVKPEFTEAQITELTILDTLLKTISRNDCDYLQSNQSAKLQFKLIGAWINLRYGWHGMAFSCGPDGSLSEVVGDLWDDIGAW